MKKILFILLIAGVTCYGQSNELPLNQKFDQNKTEIKLNLFSIASVAIDLEIERTINENSSVGIGFLSTFSDGYGFSAFAYDTAFTGFYRRYFGKKYAQGFFLEGFGRYHIDKRGLNIENNLLLGVGTGYKHVFKNGIILQADFGVGRNVFRGGGDKFLGKGGFSLGFRF